MPIVLYITACANYLLFHAIVETFAVVVAALIFTLAIRTYQHSKNDTFLFLGIAYLYIGILDFAHMLSYKGMGVFSRFGSDVPTQLWVAGRFLETVSFLVILFMVGKRINQALTASIYGVVTASLLLSIMVFRTFPVCFAEGQGLTSFKIGAEYVIIGLLAVAVYVFYRKKEYFGDETFKFIGVAMVATAAAELCFTLYTDVYGVANMLGHLLKVVSYYFLFSGVLVQGVDAPYSMISSELKTIAITDEITGVLNRKGMVQAISESLSFAAKQKMGFGILLMDLDNFKLVNDRHGHLFGDKILKDFATLLKSELDKDNVVCRFGGDEFVVLAQNIDSAGLAELKEQIDSLVRAWVDRNDKLLGLGVSVGLALSIAGQPSDVDSMLKMADESMYAVKNSKRQKPQPTTHRKPSA